jgi:hypothetical protein
MEVAKVTSMIRNVVMVKLRDGYHEDWLRQLVSRFQLLNTRGTIAYTIGRDLDLRDDNWTLAIVADIDAYREYDADDYHNQLRAELATQVEQIARVQFQPFGN